MDRVIPITLIITLLSLTLLYNIYIQHCNDNVLNDSFVIIYLYDNISHRNAFVFHYLLFICSFLFCSGERKVASFASLYK